MLYPDDGPELALVKLEYRLNAGKEIDLESPRDFAEKLHWLKLFDRQPLYGQLVDKFEVRRFVEQRVGQHILNECFGVFESPEDVDFPALPRKCMIKATHGWNMNMVVADTSAIDLADFRATTSAWLETRHELRHAEWAYSQVPARLMAEELLDDGHGQSPADVKIFCFNGEPQFCKADLDREIHHSQCYLSLAWDPLPFGNPRVAGVGRPPPRPQAFKEMIDIARKLSNGIPFVRVDLFEVGGRPRFGELTLYPCGGNLHVTPVSWQVALGDLLSLPKRP